MAEKRKLPARERREPPAKRRVSEAAPQSSRRKASTPVAVRTPAPEPVPEPTPEQVEEPLPTKIKEGEALVTRRKPQPSTLSDKDYQTIAESAVLLVSLDRSKKKWLSDGIFERYWTKPKKTKREQIEGKNPPKESMTKVGPCKIIIEPHHFDGMIYTVKDPNAKTQVQIPPQQRHIVHYGPPPPNNGYQYQHYAPPNQMRPAPYNYPPPPHPQNAHPRPPPPPPPQRQPSSQPPPPQPAKPSPDPVIQMLATRAAANPELKALMRVVASSKASQEQLRTFQAHIDELNAIIRQREEQQRRQQQLQPPQPRPPQPSQLPQHPSQAQAQPGQSPATQPQQQDQTQPPPARVTPSPATPATPAPATAPAPNQAQTQSTPNASSPAPTPAVHSPTSNNTSTAQVKTEPGTPAAATTSQTQPPAAAPSVAAGPPGPSPSPAPAASPAPGPVPQVSPAPRALPPSPAPLAGSPYPNGPPQYPPYQQPPYHNTPPPIKARNAPHYGPVSGPHGAFYQSGPAQAPPKPPIKAVVFEFTSPLTPYGSSTSGHAGSGDRYLFPENTILEYQAGGTIVIASFLIVRKVDPNTKFPIESPSDIAPKSKSKSTKSKKKDKEKAENGGTPTPAPEKKDGDAGKGKTSDNAASTNKDAPPLALADGENAGATKDGNNGSGTTVKKESTENTHSNLKEYYQPMTLRIYSSKPAILEPLSRIVKPAAEVRKYMEEVMDRAERAPVGFLAFRLPREENAPVVVDPDPEADTDGNNKTVEVADGKTDQDGAEEPEVLEDDDLKEFWDAPSRLVPLPA